MFYLAKFCRICITPSDKLFDIDSCDYDSVEFSKKLEICTKKVINKEDLSTQICMSCVEKLRISYVFQEMCLKSDDILQKYLKELLRESQMTNSKFINSELKVTLTPLSNIKVEKADDYGEVINNGQFIKVPHIKLKSFKSSHLNKIKKKRVSKDQRCSLLKKLLLTINNNTIVSTPTQPSAKSPINKKQRRGGGLKDLLVFIKGYDFGYKINEPVPESRENTALDKLERFSQTFFYADFADYRNTILSVIESNVESSDDDEMFDAYDEEEDKRLWAPDESNLILIKQERLDIDEEEITDNDIAISEEVSVEPVVKIKTEVASENEDEAGFLPSQLVQACYDEGVCVKSTDYASYRNKNGLMHKYQNSIVNSSVISHSSSLLNAPSSLELLQQFTIRTKSAKRTISPNNLKCRTRGQPFINPHLMEQFQKRSFKCDTCNRCFKSPGYLHSHCTKMGH